MSSKCVVFTFALTLIVAGLAATGVIVQQRFKAATGSQRATSGEAHWQALIHHEIGGVMEYQLEDRTRVDILTTYRAIEIDWQDKWAEGVGQSLHYSFMTNRPPLVILLATNGNWEKHYGRVCHCGVDCWVYDTVTEKWLIRGEYPQVVPPPQD